MTFRDGSSKSVRDAREALLTLRNTTSPEDVATSLEKITIGTVTTVEGDVLMKDVGTVSLKSDADVTCRVAKSNDVNKFKTAVTKALHSESLSWTYDLNFYLSTENTGDTSQFHFDEKDLSTCKMFLRAKLYRHGLTNTFANIRDGIEFDPAAYRTYTDCQENMKNMQTEKAYASLRRAEQAVYNKMCHERKKYLNPCSLIQLSYPEFFKIEGYVLLPTLRVHLASLETNAEYAKFNETDLLAAFMENLVDAAIHMNDDTVYKKTKYFKRLYIALLIFRKLKCKDNNANEESFLSDIIDEAQELHKLSRAMKVDAKEELKERSKKLLCVTVETIQTLYGKQKKKCGGVTSLRELVETVVLSDDAAETNACERLSGEQT